MVGGVIMKNLFILMIVCAMIQIVTEVAVFELVLAVLSGMFSLVLNMMIAIFQSV